MQLLDNFCSSQKIDRRTAYRWRDSGKIITTTISGKTHVLTTPEEIEHYSSVEQSNQPAIDEIKKMLNRLILKASRTPDRKKEIFKLIESEVSRLSAEGIKIVGFDTKSLYRKIKNVSSPGLGIKALQRKERADKHIIRNVALSKNLSKLLPLAARLYFENAQANISQLVDYIKDFAKIDEDYYEFAAIPTATLRRTLTREYQHSGYDNLHKFLNHHNTWRNTNPKVTGAFTDHFVFMDRIIGDDHKADVFKVFVWDQANAKTIEKKVQIWTWIEAKTGFDLAHIVKFGEINSEDVLNSMIELIQVYGLPKTEFTVDNGIAKSERIKSFMERLNHPCANVRAVEAYTPTAKAFRERSFGFYKNEFDAYFKNFIGPDKERESRHSGRQLSPEETNTWFEDYRNALDNYLDGFYANRPRRRVINGEARKVSIREYFNENWESYEPVFVTPQQLRYAISKEETKRFAGQLSLKGETFICDPSSPPAASFLNRDYIVLYNPKDLSAVDLYAKDAVIDCNSGEFFQRGQLVMTLNNTRSVDNPQQQVSNLKKDMFKSMKKLAEEMTNFSLKDEKFSPIQTTPTGKIIDHRKEVNKRTHVMLTSIIDKIDVKQEIQLQPDDTEESTLHYSDEATSTSLTYED